MNTPYPGAELVTAMPRSQAEIAAVAFLARYENPNTRNSYGLTLRLWFEFCAWGNVDPLEVERAHIELFARHLEAKGNKQSTVANRLNALAGFYKFAHLDGRITQNPMAYVNRPTILHETTTNSLSRTEFCDMLALAEERNPVWHALLCLLGLNGFRVGEVMQIDCDGITMDKGFYMVTVRRKGGKIDTQSLSNVTAWSVEKARNGRLSGPLFVKPTTGMRMDRRDAGRMIRILQRELGITKRLSPHSFRHTHVTLCLDSGLNARDIMASTGHRDSRMVSYYDHRQNSPARAATHALTAYVAGAA